MVSLKTVGAPASHVEFGAVAVPRTTLEITVSARAVNVGGTSGRLAMKLTLIEKLVFLTDARWVQYTPLAREGGPGLVVDNVARTTRQSTALDVLEPLVEPGATGQVETTITLPGTLQADMQAFWNGHEGARFKVVAELLHVGAAGEFIASLSTHTFEQAFMMAAIAKPTTFLVSGDTVMLVRVDGALG